MITLEQVDDELEAIKSNMDIRYRKYLQNAYVGGYQIGSLFGEGYIDDLSTELSDEELINFIRNRKENISSDIKYSFLNRYRRDLEALPTSDVQRDFLKGLEESIEDVVKNNLTSILL